MSDVTDAVAGSYLAGHKQGVRDGVEATVAAVRALAAAYPKGVPNAALDRLCIGMLEHVGSVT